MHGCSKCKGMTGMLLLLVGIVFLLVDVGVWTFWGIQWWTALFIIFGVSWMAKSGCKACSDSCCKTKEMSKKK